MTKQTASLTLVLRNYPDEPAPFADKTKRVRLNMPNRQEALRVANDYVKAHDVLRVIVETTEVVEADRLKNVTPDNFLDTVTDVFVLNDDEPIRFGYDPSDPPPH